jgi:hypothetical protein
MNSPSISPFFQSGGGKFIKGRLFIARYLKNHNLLNFNRLENLRRYTLNGHVFGFLVRGSAGILPASCGQDDRAPKTENVTV